MRDHFECQCGGQQGYIAVGPHCWLTCESCQTAEYWGYGISSAGDNQTAAERAQAMIDLSAYRVAPEHEHAMGRTEIELEQLSRLVPRLLKQNPDAS